MSKSTIDPAGRQFARADAQEFCAQLTETVDELIRVLNEETKLVRAARLADAAALGDEKSELSNRYSRSHATLTSAHQEIGTLAPVEIAGLRRRHSALEEALASNLAVLASARTVSETLIRDLADSLSRREAGPRTYGADASAGGHSAAASPFSVNVAL